MLGGHDIEDECEAFVKSGDKPLPGQAFVTKPGKLDTCTCIIHAVVRTWQGGHQNEDDLLFTAVSNSLQIAASRKLSTVAIAGVDCGFPAAASCASVLDAVADFQSQQQQQHHFTEILLIDNRDQIVNHFHENLARHFGKQQVKIVSGQLTEMPTASARMIPCDLLFVQSRIQSSQADKTVKCEVLFSTRSHSLLPRLSHLFRAFTYFPLFFLSLFPHFFHISFPFPFSVAKRPLRIQLGDFGEHCGVRGSRVRPPTHF